MSTPIRYAIWAAVSTDAQAAEDKYSLPEQEERCRRVGEEKGWQETVDPYIVAGESRTRWVNLSDAEKAIPELKQLLDDAQAGKFDVVVMAEYDRFRSLLEPVSRTLSHYGVQLYSVAQPLEPQNPAEFSPYTNDTAFTIQGLNQIISQAQVANLRRKYLTQMPLRILNKGLPQLIPMGYRKPLGRETDRNAVPEQDPEMARWVLYMKDQLLAGVSIQTIAAELDKMGAPLPGTRWNKTTSHWHPTTVRRTLSNPFYAGYVQWGRKRHKLDPRTGKSRSGPGKPILARGKHIPLWDDETHQAILAEISRRTPQYKGRKSAHLSGLLYCHVCGAPVWRSKRGSAPNRQVKVRRKQPYYQWSCSKGYTDHVSVRDDALLPRVAALVVESIRHPENMHQEMPGLDYVRLDELRAQRQRLGDAYKRGLFDLDEFARLLDPVDAEIEAIQAAEKAGLPGVRKSNARQDAINTLISLGDDVARAIEQGDPVQVNRVLKMLYDKIVIDANGNIIRVENSQ